MNRFGKNFSISIFGESHGPVIGLVIDGCPAGIPLSVKDFVADIQRRRSGAKGTTKRTEQDIPEILSGVYNGKTTGAPVTVVFRNNDIRSADYSEFADIPRPGHADFVAGIKYDGFADLRGGGHFSGRMTLALVAAGVVAKKICKGMKFAAAVIEAGGIKDIEKAVAIAMKKGDSAGGIAECRVNGVPAGLGEPFFDSAESLISHLIFSVPGIKGIEFGAGFSAAAMKGSAHNDVFVSVKGKTASNHAGGINGGITNGNELVFRVAVKPTSSFPLPQKTINMKTEKMTVLEITGRHDTCIALRMPVIIEAAAAIALADLLMQHKARK
jgi:chorismate synthase